MTRSTHTSCDQGRGRRLRTCVRTSINRKHEVLDFRTLAIKVTLAQAAIGRAPGHSSSFARIAARPAQLAPVGCSTSQTKVGQTIARPYSACQGSCQIRASSRSPLAFLTIPAIDRKFSKSVCRRLRDFGKRRAGRAASLAPRICRKCRKKRGHRATVGTDVIAPAVAAMGPQHPAAMVPEDPER